MSSATPTTVPTTSSNQSSVSASTGSFFLLSDIKSHLKLKTEETWGSNSAVFSGSSLGRKSLKRIGGKKFISIQDAWKLTRKLIATNFTTFVEAKGGEEYETFSKGKSGYGGFDALPLSHYNNSDLNQYYNKQVEGGSEKIWPHILTAWGKFSRMAIAHSQDGFTIQNMW